MKNFIGSAYEHSSKGANPTQFQLTLHTQWGMVLD